LFGVAFDDSNRVSKARELSKVAGRGNAMVTETSKKLTGLAWKKRIGLRESHKKRHDAATLDLRWGAPSAPHLEF